MPVRCRSGASGTHSAILSFGGPVQPKLDSLEVAQIIADAKTEGLIEMTSYHDDDLVPWDPEHPEDDLDPKSAACSVRHRCLDRDLPGSRHATCPILPAGWEKQSCINLLRHRGSYGISPRL